MVDVHVQDVSHVGQLVLEEEVECPRASKVGHDYGPDWFRGDDGLPGDRGERRVRGADCADGLFNVLLLFQGDGRVEGRLFKGQRKPEDGPDAPGHS